MRLTKIAFYVFSFGTPAVLPATTLTYATRDAQITFDFLPENVQVEISNFNRDPPSYRNIIRGLRLGMDSNVAFPGSVLLVGMSRPLAPILGAQWFVSTISSDIVEIRSAGIGSTVSSVGILPKYDFTGGIYVPRPTDRLFWGNAQMTIPVDLLVRTFEDVWVVYGSPCDDRGGSCGGDVIVRADLIDPRSDDVTPETSSGILVVIGLIIVLGMRLRFPRHLTT